MDEMLKAYVARLNTPEFKTYLESLSALMVKIGSIADAKEREDFSVDLLALEFVNSKYLQTLTIADLTEDERNHIVNSISTQISNLLAGRLEVVEPEPKPGFGFNGPMGSA